MTVAMKQGSQSQHSKLLSNGENQALVALLGAKCQSLCTSVIQLFLTYAPDHTQWRRHDAGVICFVKDHLRRSYFFRLFCLTRRQIVWEQEVYTDMDYVAARPWLHTFEAESSMAAFNFANEDEANSFMVVVLRQLQNKRQRRVEKTNERKRLSMGEIPGSTPKLAGSVGALNGPPSHRHHHHRSASSGTTKDKKKDKESLKKKIKKEDIGVPLNFRHVSHVGWDQNKGFDVDLEQIQDPNLKKFFEKAGVSETQLQDRTTREFIYDFIEKNGGLEAVKDDVVIVGRPTKAPPVPSRAPPLPSQHKMAPPPPSVTRACPPTPVTQRNAPPPPPPPSGKPSNQSTAAPPPPPPPPEMSPVPPPPPPAAPVTAAAPSFPAPADPRAELMAAIKSGRTLKHVEVEKKPTPDSRGELLSQIRQGVELKSVPQTELQKQAPSEPADGLAGALARALAERSRAFHDSDSESDSGSGDSDSEWEE